MEHPLVHREPGALGQFCPLLHCSRVLSMASWRAQWDPESAGHSSAQLNKTPPDCFCLLSYFTLPSRYILKISSLSVLSCVLLGLNFSCSLSFLWELSAVWKLVSDRCFAQICCTDLEVTSWSHI